MKFKLPLSTYAARIFAWNTEVGWWDEGDNRDLYTCIQLISTEVSEATEGFRKDLMDNHLPQYKMEAVELADALIRTLDLAGYWAQHYEGFELTNLKAFNSYCWPQCSTGKQHLGLTKEVVNLANTLDTMLGFDSRLEHSTTPNIKDLTYNLSWSTTGLINSIMQVAENSNYPLEEIMLAKMEYNRTRLDHKRENRNKQNGKKI